ncbi:ATP-binding protein [Desulfosporosinus sp. BICA1-9]|uniref:AAA family ATPase n=1 Tax=Desulfosporosinus sp. BICA1-9 TaxID=1531958 RepID=UPI00054B6B03|nr:ATP-binding protein [Desulfosporosinus sp. BICA1-9]KJS50256.1 MAG: ATPase [Peptococcaceae bacterium BRH_c23]KJS86792.1 MAG: ATPase [Desulfosporosinus sp. BICA1-9]HBW37840.1 ATP-binding protein [Desulfosporosinus sp.]
MPSRLFPLGGPVSEKDIVDREDFLLSLGIRLIEGQSIMLAGPRRIGKTSLALEVLRRLKTKDSYVAFIDLFRYNTKKQLSLAIIDACLENRSGISKTTAALKDGLKRIASGARLTAKIQDLEFEVGLPGEGRDDDELFNYALRLPEILAKKDKKQIVVVFDEFQEVIRIAGEDTLKVMRSYFQRQEGVSYLFLGSKEGMMNTIFGDKRQAFYRFATILPIPPIPTDAWKEYLSSKYLEKRIAVNERTILEILDLSGGHPQDTMLLCSEIYYALIEAGEATLTLDFVRTGYTRALLTLSPVFDELLDELGKVANVRHVLIGIAKGLRIYSGLSGNPNEIKRAVDTLVSRAVIEKSSRGSYNFVEPMLKHYLIEKIDVY